MAITSKSQILDTSKVYNATAYLSEAIGYLNAAKTNLTTAKGYASYDNFHTNLGNTFPETPDEIVKMIEELVSDIKTLKTAVEAKAVAIKDNETSQYKQYLESLEEDEEQNDDGDSGDGYYHNLPYHNGSGNQVVRL